MASCLDGKTHFCAYEPGRSKFEIWWILIIGIVLDLGLGEAFSLFFHLSIDFIEVVIQILKNHVEFLGDQKNFFEFDDIRAVQLAQRLDLSEFDALIPTCIFGFHLLYGNYFSRFDVLSFVHCSEGPVA